MAHLLHPKPSEESETSKQSKNSAKSTKAQGVRRPKKRKADADTTVNFKKVCLCLEVSTMVAGLQMADLEAAKKFVADRLASKNPTEA